MTLEDEPIEAFRRSTLRPLDVADAETQLPAWTRELLACLTKRARAAFVLRQAGMSFDQIGRHLGVSSKRASQFNIAAERRMVAAARRATQLHRAASTVEPHVCKTGTPCGVPPHQRALLDLPLDAFEFSVRAHACLYQLGARRLGHVVALPEESYLRTKNLGAKTLREIIVTVGRFGLHLGMDVGDWRPSKEAGTSD